MLIPASTLKEYGRVYELLQKGDDPNAAMLKEDLEEIHPGIEKEYLLKKTNEIAAKKAKLEKELQTPQFASGRLKEINQKELEKVSEMDDEAVTQAVKVASNKEKLIKLLNWAKENKLEKTKIQNLEEAIQAMDKSEGAVPRELFDTKIKPIISEYAAKKPKVYGENTLPEAEPIKSSFVNSSGDTEEVTENPVVAEYRTRYEQAKNTANQGIKPFPNPAVVDYAPAHREALDELDKFLNTRKEILPEEQQQKDWFTQLVHGEVPGKDLAKHAATNITEEELEGFENKYAKKVLEDESKSALEIFKELEDDILAKENVSLGKFALQNAYNSSARVNEEKRNKELQARRLRDFQRTLAMLHNKTAAQNRAEALGRAVHQREMELRSANLQKDISAEEFLRQKAGHAMRGQADDKIAGRQKDFLDNRVDRGAQETARNQELLNQEMRNHALEQAAPYDAFNKTAEPLRAYAEATGLNSGANQPAPIPTTPPETIIPDTSGTQLLGTAMQAGGVLMAHQKAEAEERRAQEAHHAGVALTNAQRAQIEREIAAGRTQ